MSHTISLRDCRAAHGFGLLEALVSTALVVTVMGITLTAMNVAMRANMHVKQTTDMNGQLRSALDVFVRDALQTAQGLPNSKRLTIPSGGIARQLTRPGPPGSALLFPQEASLAAVTPGPDLGHAVDGVATDMITLLMADPFFEQIGVSALTEEPATMTIAQPNITDGGRDDVRAGDLLFVRRGNATALVYASSINGQVVTFAAGDPFDLNQFDPTLETAGTFNAVARQLPTLETRVTRIRMVTYYIDRVTTPRIPTLMRRVNMRPAAAVAFGIENMQITYDVGISGTIFSSVRLVESDLEPGGACGAELACSPNQISRVNVVLSGRSWDKSQQLDDYLRNTVYAQVSLRNLSFMDQYLGGS